MMCSSSPVSPQRARSSSCGSGTDLLAANNNPGNRCLGHRPYDPVSKTYGAYVWEDYATVQRRRANFGAGLIKLLKDAGVKEERGFGIGLWCQNRPEWQIAGT